MDKNKVKLGAAPIAWTNDDLPSLGAENTFAQCVSEMALAAFRELKKQCLKKSRIGRMKNGNVLLMVTIKLLSSQRKRA